jgi:hypothetical protein
MKTFLAGIVAAALLSAAALAQDATPAPQTDTPAQPEQTAPAPATSPAHPSAAQPTTPQPTAAPASAAQTPATKNTSTFKIAPGSVIPVQLTKTLDAKKAKSGDPVEAKATQDMKSTSGELIVPKDTKIVGHVTESQPRNKDQKESQVGIAFDHAVLKNEGDVPLPMSIQAIIGPRNPNPSASNSAADAPQPSPSAPSANSGGRSPAMGSGASEPVPSSSTNDTAPQANASNNSNANQPITGNTRGVVGITNLTLAPAANATAGSILTSDKNNVKLDGGTLMLLRVNP